MNVFGMVTTRHSHDYTGHALASFFQTTDLGADDRFFLIDNDGSLDPALAAGFPRVTTIVNAAPLSFAANVNQVMSRAWDLGADLVFLNNDLIFPVGWWRPLRVRLPVVLSPVSNFQMPYRGRNWDCGPVLELADYLDHEEEFRALARAHQSTVRGYQAALTVPFFCVKIPYCVYTAVGPLEESLGAGGGEDRDYCLRCQLAGFPVQFALDAYVLHFMGKSTWRGAETSAERQARETAYLTGFQDKWGRRLADLACLGRREALPAESGLEDELARGNFQRVIERLLARERLGNGWLLTDLYAAACGTPSDINEHCPVLSGLARECRHVTEMGTRTGVSTTALLFAQPERLVCYDLCKEPRVDLLRAVAGRTEFVFHEADVRAVTIEETDLLFIDTWHTYEQLRTELHLHADKVRRYIVLHDTTTFAERGESPGQRGLWPVVEEFLARGTFRLQQRYEHNHGLTILEKA